MSGARSAWARVAGAPEAAKQPIVGPGVLLLGAAVVAVVALAKRAHAREEEEGKVEAMELELATLERSEAYERERMAAERAAAMMPVYPLHGGIRWQQQ